MDSILSPTYVLQLDGTLLWAWTFCHYSRIVVISAVIINEVDCSMAGDLRKSLFAEM